MTTELTDDAILAIAHRKASTYTHRSDPTSHAYGFVKHTVIDFARAIEAAALPVQPSSAAAALILKLRNVDQHMFQPELINILYKLTGEAADMLAAYQQPVQPDEWEDAALDALSTTHQDFPVGTAPHVIINAISDWYVSVALNPELSLPVRPAPKMYVPDTMDFACVSVAAQDNRQPLTDDQIIDLAVQWPAETNDCASHFDFARAIEAAHGIKQ